MDLTRDGNARAFEAIVQRYRRPLLRYCGRLLPESRAEDAVQQAFLSAYSAIMRGDAELRLRPWLYRIAHNAALNLLRQNGWNHEELSERIDGVETPLDAVQRGERLRTVFAALRDLPERQRDALMLSAMAGRSYEEIAGELGVTGGAVRQLLNRARTTLRAGATALTPPGLLTKLVESSDGSIADRIAQAGAGAAGGGAIVKLAAGLVVAGAVVGGATQVAPSRHADASAPAHAARVGSSSGSGAGARSGSGSTAAVTDGRGGGLTPSGRHARGGGTGRTRRHGRHGHGDTALSPVADHSGPGPSGSSDGGGDHGGTSGDGHSGSSGDSGTSGSGTSGGSDGGSGGSGTSGDGGGSTTTTTSDGGGGTSGSDGGSTTSGTSDGGGTSGKDSSSQTTTTTSTDGGGTSGGGTSGGSTDGH